MLLYIFTGSLLPYVEGLDSWLFEGTLDDPFEEVILHESCIVYLLVGARCYENGQVMILVWCLFFTINDSILKT